MSGPTPEQQAANKKINEETIPKLLSAIQAGNMADQSAAFEKFALVTDVDRYQVAEAVYIPLVADLEAHLKQGDLKTVTAQLNFIAELAKTPANRERIGKSELIQTTWSLLDSADDNTKIALLRVLANVVAENEKNRELLTQLGFLEKALQLIRSDNETISRNAAAALSNTVEDNDALQEKLLSLGALSTLLENMSESKDPETLRLLSFGILTFLETEKGIKEFLELKGLEKILQLANSQNPKIRTLSIKALETLAQYDSLKRPLYEHKCVDFMLAAVNSDAALDQKQSAAKSLAHILTNDSNMNDLFQRGQFEGFRKWLEHEDVVIRAFAALCISNLARTDVNCIQLVKQGLTPSLVTLLKRSDSKEKQGALAALRNLSLPKENKTLVGESGIIEEMLHILDGDQLALKFPAVVVAKILATGNEQNARKLLSSGFAARLHELMESTQHEGVRCESARVLVQIALFKQDDLLNELVKIHFFKAIQVLLDSQHEILRNEALDTLLLFTHLEAHRSRLISNSAGAISKILQGENQAHIDKVFTVLEKSIDKESAEAVQSSTVIEDLETLAKGSSANQGKAAHLLSLVKS